MRARLLVVLVLGYVSLDLSSPWVAGAFTFDPDESVEAAFARPRMTASGMPQVATPPSVPTSPPSMPRVAPRSEVVARPFVEWVVDLRRAHSVAVEPTRPAEDG
jgi:hypothetical protein